MAYRDDFFRHAARDASKIHIFDNGRAPVSKAAVMGAMRFVHPSCLPIKAPHREQRVNILRIFVDAYTCVESGTKICLNESRRRGVMRTCPNGGARAAFPPSPGQTGR